MEDLGGEVTEQVMHPVLHVVAADLGVVGGQRLRQEDGVDARDRVAQPLAVVSSQKASPLRPVGSKVGRMSLFSGCMAVTDSLLG